MARTKPQFHQSPEITSPEPSVSGETPAADRGVAMAIVEFPLSTEIVGPAPHYVDVAIRSPDARAGLSRLREGLRAAGATVSGRPVESNADAIRAVLETLGRQ